MSIFITIHSANRGVGVEINEAVLAMIADCLSIGAEGCQQNPENSEANLKALEEFEYELREFLPIEIENNGPAQPSDFDEPQGIE